MWPVKKNSVFSPPKPPLPQNPPPEVKQKAQQLAALLMAKKGQS